MKDIFRYLSHLANYFELTTFCSYFFIVLFLKYIFRFTILIFFILNKLRTIVHSFHAHNGRVEALLFVEGFVWSGAQSIRMWDTKTFENILTLQKPHVSGIRVLRWVSVSPDESYVWSGDVDGLICIWDIQVSFHKLKYQKK